MKIFVSCNVVNHEDCPQFVIVYLGCGKRVMSYSSGDYLNPGKSVSDYVVLSGNVKNVSGEL
jgi:hypothetical protein